MESKYCERESLIKIFTTNEKIDKVSLSFVRAVIKNAAPAADVVEVIRCKDCKYYAAMITDTVSGNMETAPWGICTLPWFNSDEYDVQENGYCSYGKRKMDKEE